MEREEAEEEREEKEEERTRLKNLQREERKRVEESWKKIIESAQTKTTISILDQEFPEEIIEREILTPAQSGYLPSPSALGRQDATRPSPSALGRPGGHGRMEGSRVIMNMDQEFPEEIVEQEVPTPTQFECLPSPSVLGRQDALSPSSSALGGRGVHEGEGGNQSSNVISTLDQEFPEEETRQSQSAIYYIKRSTTNTT